MCEPVLKSILLVLGLKTGVEEEIFLFLLVKIFRVLFSAAWPVCRLT